MTFIMRYELFYLIGASREAESDSIREEVKKIITESDGVFEEKETLEKRRLAYLIKPETHGIYIAQRFELPQDKISEISSKINLLGGVMRFMISRADELPELKTKEERISEAAAGLPKEDRKPEEKTRKTKEPAVKMKEKPQEKTTASEDDIDKKLEEILNI